MSSSAAAATAEDRPPKGENDHEDVDDERHEEDGGEGEKEVLITDEEAEGRVACLDGGARTREEQATAIRTRCYSRIRTHSATRTYVLVARRIVGRL